MKAKVKLFFAVPLLLLLVYSVLVAATPKPQVLPKLADIPLTNHAANAKRNYGAADIKSMIINRKCKPTMAFACDDPDNPHIKLICEIKPGLWGGLIIGTKFSTPVIVTGYPQQYNQWMSNSERDNCVPIAYVP